MRLRHLTRALLWVLTALAAAGTLTSCLGKKNTAARRQYTAFITRYNIYFNGDEHYKKTLEEMETKYEDDYTRQVFIHPVEAKADAMAPQPSGNFDRSIEKAQKAIQVRSIKQRPAKKAGKASDPAYKEWMKRDEYNPFLHNAWMMMGRSQYYNGDFLGAASTFFYVSRHFTWLPATVTEARLWQAMAYLALDWKYEAELILSRIKEESLTSGELRKLYNTAWADYYLRSEMYTEALPYLKKAASAASGAQKVRLNFLSGQVYERLGMNDMAYEAFSRAGSSSSASYRTRFNARIKQSEVFTGQNIEPEVRALRRMTRYDRNADYLDQIYYAIGNLYLSRADTSRAIENYKLAAEKSKRNGVEKAISQLTLGGLYFDRGQYELAQPCYAEAIPMLPKSYPDYNNLKRRSDVLDELAVYAQNVTLQDSLLTLSYKTPEEQRAVVDKIIAELNKKEKEEAEAAAREEYLADQAAKGNGLSDKNAPNAFNINADNSWYFYNAATRNQGRTEFQRRWGSRKLEDDWRRRNKASFSFDDFNPQDSETAQDADTGSDTPDSSETQQSDGSAEHMSDPHYPEYYLSQIPTSDAERLTCKDIIQEGLYNMGVILKDKLDDFNGAKTEFDRLLKEYPDNVYRLDVYYNLYLMYARRGNNAQAEHYRNLILSDFPDSPYGVAMKNPDYLDNLRRMDSHQNALYEEAFNAYMDNRNATVHSVYDKVSSLYPRSPLMPKFMFLHALAYVTEHKPQEFNSVLRELLERYPDTDLTPLASAWLKGMAAGRELNTTSSAGNMRGMVWDIRLTGDSTAVAASDAPLEFDLNPDTRQLLVLLYPTDVVSTNQLLYSLARHNFSSFVVKDFDLEPMNFGRLGMIVIRGFANMAELNHYRAVMGRSTEFRLPPGVRPVVISEANFKALLDGGRSFDEYFRYLEEHNYIDAQRHLIPVEEIETLQEAEQAEKEASQPAQESPESNQQPSSLQPEQTGFDSDPEQVPQDAPQPVPAPLTPVPEPQPVPVVTDPVPETTPAPATEPAPTPEPIPSPATEPAKAPAPAVTPVKPSPQPAMPEYEPGSEGDDEDNQDLV